jgi:hypothetical protein
MAGTRPCSKCAKRRQKIEALRAKRKAQGKPVQAAALGAVLAVSGKVGQAIGISGEEPNGPHSGSDESGDAEGMAGSEG